MSEIVNLRQARKRRDRDEKRRKADENAAKHGRGKAERARGAALTELETRRHEGHRLEDEERAPEERESAREGDSESGPESGA